MFGLCDSQNFSLALKSKYPPSPLSQFISMTGRKPVAEEVTWSIFYYFPHLTFYLNPFLLKATRKGEDL